MANSHSTAVAFAVSVALGTLALTPTSSLAQSAEPEATGLDEIVVTARKREETLSDVSAAVSVVGGEALRTGVINDVRDLQNIAPQLNVGEVVGLMKITMRGLGNTSNTRGEDTEVAFYVDGAVVARQEAQSMAMFDLDRIEVLRGPQGTLYGRNSTGGTLNLITAKPTPEFSGYANVMGGNYDFLKLDGALSGPLSENILGRIAVQSISRDGFGENITTGNQIDDDDRKAVRGHLQFNFSDDTQLLLSGEYGKADDSSGLFTYYSPLYVVNVDDFPPPANQGAKGVGGFSDPNSRDGAGNIDPKLERKTKSLTATFTSELSPNLTLKNILNWRDMHYYLAQDLDLSTVVPTPVTNTATVSIPLYDRQLSNELQLTYSTDQLTLIGGVYGFEEYLRGRTSVGETDEQNIWFYREGNSKGTSYAGFFNASYDFTDLITARIGGRYNHDKRRIENVQWVLGTLTVPAIANDERTDSKYTGEYGLDFNVNDNTLLYYTFSQGYRQGAAVIMQNSNPIIQPTTVSNHEVGLKFETADGTFAVDVAAYDAKIKDLQRTQAVPLPPPSTAFVTLINNIDGLEVRGVELNTQWRPVRQLMLSAGVAYTDAEFEEYTTDDPLQFNNLIADVAGNTPQLAPKWKGNVAAEYAIAVGSTSELVLGAGATYVGKQYFDEFNRAPMLEDNYTLWDANVTYHATDNWSVGIWGKNLGDEKEIADMSFSALGRVVSKKFINPRTYGASVNYKF